MNYDNNIQLIPVYYHEMWLRLIANWRNDHRVKRGLRSAMDTDYDGQVDWISKVRKSDDQYFYIVKKEKREVVSRESTNKSDTYSLLLGYCGLDKIHIANRTAEVSLLIAPPFQRSGHGAKVIYLLLKKAFHDINLNLVFAETYFNKEFWNKCGFKDEAVLRNRKYADGKYHNSYMLSINKEEFNKAGKR